MLQIALKYIQRGFGVVALRPDTKKPQLKNFTKDPIRDERVAKAYWAQSPHCGVGLVMGWGGLAAIDVDVNHGGSLDFVESLPRTVTTVSRNGYHPYFLVEPGRPINNHELFPALPGTTKTQAPAYLWVRDHQMVAPPTVVSLGNNDEELSPFEYKFLTDAGGERSFDECPIAPLPEYFYLDAISNGGKVGVSRNEYPDGTRHQMLVDTAVAMRKKGKSIDEIREALYLRNEKDCKPPKPKGEIDREIKGIIDEWLVKEVAIATVSESSVGGQVDSGTEGQVVVEGEFPDKGLKGGNLATIPNVKEVVKRLGAVVRYNVISKQEELLIPGRAFSMDNKDNAVVAYIQDACCRWGVPRENLLRYITAIADENQYNPVASWVLSKPWDGQSRLRDLYDTVDAKDNKLKQVLMFRWLISAIAAALEPEGIQAHGILVFQGLQNSGKTRWFDALVPKDLKLTRNGIILKLDNRDSIAQATSIWLGELGEIEATFTKSAIAQIKAFVTQNEDVFRRPFALRDSHYPRRTVFFGSVNDPLFLNDPTGNRRFWVIECLSVQHDHKVDMQQLWAEVYELYRAGTQWHLTSDEMCHLNGNNEQFTTVDPIQELIQSYYDWTLLEREKRTASSVLMDMGYIKPTLGECRAAGRALRTISGANPTKSHGDLVFNVPPRPTMPEPNFSGGIYPR